jgi:hypothetical protein
MSEMEIAKHTKNEHELYLIMTFVELRSSN